MARSHTSIMAAIPTFKLRRTTMEPMGFQSFVSPTNLMVDLAKNDVMALSTQMIVVKERASNP